MGRGGKGNGEEERRKKGKEEKRGKNEKTKLFSIVVMKFNFFFNFRMPKITLSFSNLLSLMENKVIYKKFFKARMSRQDS